MAAVVGRGMHVAGWIEVGALDGIGDALDPPGDVHASADYRRRLAEVCCERAVLAAAKRAKG